MGWLVFALGLAIPATIPACHFGGLPGAFGLAFIWAAFALVVALGLIEQSSAEPQGSAQSFSFSTNACACSSLVRQTCFWGRQELELA